MNVTGTSGSDTLTGTSGADVIQGLDGNDNIHGLAGNDSIDGGAGEDRAWYDDASSAVTIDLNITTAQNTGGSGSDTLVGIEDLSGSAFNDTFTGDGNSNRFDGLNGNDILYGGAGMDYLSGGDGNDKIYGGIGSDTLEGGKGNDFFQGTQGDDSINGGEGIDTVDYSTATAGVTIDLRITAQQSTFADGLDTIINVENINGSAFADTLNGDVGVNVIDGGAGNDDIFGNEGDDTLYGGTGLNGKDQMYGGAGNDALYGGDNRDDLFGGDGDDLMAGGDGDDNIDGGNGVDTVDYSSAAAGVAVDLTLTLAQNTVGGGNDTLKNVENVVGTGFADTFTGNDSANIFDGGAGNDTADGGLGADTLYGGAGDDTLTGGANVFNDFLYGGIGNDSLDGGKGDDFLMGGAGNDIIGGGVGNDTVSYADITGVGVTVDLSISVQQNTGASGGLDTLTSIENLIGSDNNDFLTGNAENNRLEGGAGSDSLYGGSGNDVLLPGSGSADAIYGGAGADLAVIGGLTKSYTLNLNAGQGSLSTTGQGITASSIETFLFQDGALTFDENNAAAVVMRMYDTAFQRLPDTLGGQFWTHLYESGGITLVDLGISFANSTEFQNAIHGMTNRQIVDFMYENTLDRAPDQAGEDTWTNYLNTHNIGELFVQFAESAEHRQLTSGVVAQGLWDGDQAYQTTLFMYEATFGRVPDAGGLTTWANALKGGLSVHDMAVAFTASGEFFNNTHLMNHSQLVDYMYQTALHRPADQQGHDAWVSYLDNGGSIADLVLQFEQSSELQVNNAAYIDHGISFGP